LNICFPEYSDGLDPEKARDFIIETFLSVNHDPRREIYPHAVSAIDPNVCNHIWIAVRNIVLHKALDAANF